MANAMDFARRPQYHPDKNARYKTRLNGCHPFPEGRRRRFKRKSYIAGSVYSNLMRNAVPPHRFRDGVHTHGLLRSRKEINEPGDKFLFPRCDRAARWRPVVETKLEEFKKIVYERRSCGHA